MIVTAYQPDVVRAVGVRCQVASRSNEGRAKGPRIGHRIIDVHFVGWIWRFKPAANNPHLRACSIVERKRTRLACAPRYEGNLVNGVSYWVINPRIDIIMVRRAYLDVAAGGVDEAVNGSGRYKTLRRGQDSSLLHPRTGKIKLPN